MGLAGMPSDELDDIKASNSADNQPKPQLSNCILVQNMFDPKVVEVQNDPYFFIEIKNQVKNVVSEWGKVD